MSYNIPTCSEAESSLFRPPKNLDLVVSISIRFDFTKSEYDLTKSKYDAEVI